MNEYDITTSPYDQHPAGPSCSIGVGVGLSMSLNWYSVIILYGVLLLNCMVYCYFCYYIVWCSVIILYCVLLLYCMVFCYHIVWCSVIILYGVLLSYCMVFCYHIVWCSVIILYCITSSSHPILSISMRVRIEIPCTAPPRSLASSSLDQLVVVQTSQQWFRSASSSLDFCVRPRRVRQLVVVWISQQKFRLASSGLDHLVVVQISVYGPAAGLVLVSVCAV